VTLETNESQAERSNFVYIFAFVGSCIINVHLEFTERVRLNPESEMLTDLAGGNPRCSVP
jgi:hypothetical protein